MIPILLKWLSFSVIRIARRLLSLLLMLLAGGNSCSFQVREKMSYCVMRRYDRLFSKLEDLAIRRLPVDTSIPFMPPSPRPFQKGVYSCWVMPRTLCRHLAGRARIAACETLIILVGSCKWYYKG